MCVCVCVCVFFSNTSTSAGCDARSIFKRSLTVLNSIFFLLDRLSFQDNKKSLINPTIYP